VLWPGKQSLARSMRRMSTYSTISRPQTHRTTVSSRAKLRYSVRERRSPPYASSKRDEHRQILTLAIKLKPVASLNTPRAHTFGGV